LRSQYYSWALDFLFVAIVWICWLCIATVSLCKLSSSQKAALKKATRQSSAELSTLTVVCNTHATARFLNIDLSKLGEKDIISAVCRFAKIDPEQLLLVWASPDCSTFSRADASNASRGNEFRGHTLWHRPPKDTVDDKRLKAIEHDGMVQNVLLSLQAMLSAPSL
jgi:hypothetical protein